MEAWVKDNLLLLFMGEKCRFLLLIFQGVIVDVLGPLSTLVQSGLEIYSVL